mmetsp:Transcript_90433/g.195720  ORF Transcript_90433/g.195720 Transcript_90433/m.195720 type:complete len:608 (-) Transcript_90433:333-2156(-)
MRPNRLPEVPDLAGVVEARSGEDVGCAVGEAEDVDVVAVHTVEGAQPPTDDDIVEANVHAEAAGHEEVARATHRERGEVMEGLQARVLHGVEAILVVAQDGAVAGLRGAHHGPLRRVLEPGEPEDGVAVHLEGVRLLVPLVVHDRHDAVFPANEHGVLADRVELELAHPFAAVDQLLRVQHLLVQRQVLVDLLDRTARAHRRQAGVSASVAPLPLEEDDRAVAVHDVRHLPARPRPNLRLPQANALPLRPPQVLGEEDARLDGLHHHHWVVDAGREARPGRPEADGEHELRELLAEVRQGELFGGLVPACMHPARGGSQRRAWRDRVAANLHEELHEPALLSAPRVRPHVPDAVLLGGPWLQQPLLRVRGERPAPVPVGAAADRPLRDDAGGADAGAEPRSPDGEARPPGDQLAEADGHVALAGAAHQHLVQRIVQDRGRSPPVFAEPLLVPRHVAVVLAVVLGGQPQLVPEEAHNGVDVLTTLSVLHRHGPGARACVECGETRVPRQGVQAEEALPIDLVAAAAARRAAAAPDGPRPAHQGTLQLLLPRRQHGEELVAGGEAVLDRPGVPLGVAEGTPEPLELAGEKDVLRRPAEANALLRGQEEA